MPTLHVEEMAEVCAFCNSDVGKAHGKRGSAVDMKELNGYRSEEQNMAVLQVQE